MLRTRTHARTHAYKRVRVYRASWQHASSKQRLAKNSADEKDTQFVIALRREHRCPQFPKHAGGVLQSVHELRLVLSLKHTSDHRITDRTDIQTKATDDNLHRNKRLPSIVSSETTAFSQPAGLLREACPAPPDQLRASLWWAAEHNETA